MRLKENMGVSMTSSPYSAPGTTSCQQPTAPVQPLLTTLTVYDDNLSAGSGAIPSPRGSPFPGDYNSLPDYGQQYVPLPNNCESWASTVSCPAPSNVSSPSSSADDYNSGYIPTSVPASILPSNSTSASSISILGHKDIVKMEYDEMDHHGTTPRGFYPPYHMAGQDANHIQCLDAGFHLNHPLQSGAPHSHPYSSHQQQPAWTTYPACYPQVQSSVH